MTVPRSKIVDPRVTPWYHCISRTVRGAFLLQTMGDDRKRYLEQRLEELVGIFSIQVGGYAVMDNHLHVLTHLDLRQVRRWSKEEVLRRWAKLHPPRGPDRKPLKSLHKWLKKKVRDRKYVHELRRRLVNLGWFMKSLKEPLAQGQRRRRGAGPILGRTVQVDRHSRRRSATGDLCLH